MKIYTKKGDSGKTSLLGNVSVSKSDDRIELLGTIDELSSHIGLAKVAADEPLRKRLSSIQKELIHLMAGIADPRSPKYRVSQEQITALEAEIDRLEASFPRAKEFILYGGCELSARLDVARAVARRAERRFRKVALNYGADAHALAYINRLSDYLYMAARFADHADGERADAEKPVDANEQLCRDVIQNVLKELSRNS